jgi:hypothetical protein
LTFGGIQLYEKPSRQQIQKEIQRHTEYLVACIREGYRKRLGGRGDRNKEKIAGKISRRS